MADKRTGLRGADKSQDHLQDARRGAYDLVGNKNIPDTNQQTPLSWRRREPMSADSRLPLTLRRQMVLKG